MPGLLNLIAFLLSGGISAIFVTGCTGNMQSRSNAQRSEVRIYIDSVVTDVSHHPVGINLDFFMDGGRFPNAKRSVTKAMTDMGMKYLRYPGGEKSDLYLFSVPPYERSAPSLARTTYVADYPDVITQEKTLRYDPLDFDEYINMCRSVGAEPVVVVAADNYLHKLKPGEKQSTKKELLAHAVAWVKYANVRKKYNVMYWMIANESWNRNNENSTVDIYVQDVIDFSKAMKAVDSSIFIIPNGASDDFFKTVIQKTGDHIDRICVSNYGVEKFYAGYKTYRDTMQTLIRPALVAINALNKYATPGQRKKLKVIVAEYGSIDWFGHWKGVNDMGHAIVTFDMAGQLLLQPQIEFSCFWNTRWIEKESKPGADHDALDKDGNFYPTGLALSIWGNFLGKQMLKTIAPAPLLSYASYDASSKKLFVYLINKSEIPKMITISLGDQRKASVKQAWEYFGNAPGDTDPVWQNKKTSSFPGEQELKGTSITVFELELT